jgi:hypothetical protein
MRGGKEITMTMQRAAHILIVNIDYRDLHSLMC